MIPQRTWPGFLIGLFVCFFCAAAPFVYTAIRTPDQRAWVPVNDQAHNCGDDKFYAATVQQIRESPFVFRSPVADTVGTYGVEIFKASGKWLAALAGLFISDVRVAYPLSFVVCFALSYIICFFVGRSAGLNPLSSAASALIVLFYYKMLQGQSYRILLNSDGTAFFESVNDNFRYVIMQSASCFAWAAQLLCVRHKPDWGWKRVAVWSLLLVGIAYSYYSLTLLSGLTLVFYSGFLAVREKGAWKWLLLVACVSCTLLLAVGFPRHVGYFLGANSQPVIQSHLASTSVTSFADRLLHFAGLAGKYVLPLAALALLLRELPNIFRWLIASALAITAILAVTLLPGRIEIVNRMIVRGLDSNWILIFAVAFLLLLQKHIRLKLRGWMGYSVLLALGSLPLIGSARIAKQTYGAENFYALQDDWEALDLIRRQSKPGAMVLALDLTANQLLPVYTDVNLYASAPNYSGYNSEEEFAKFVEGWRILDMDLNVLARWLENLPRASRQFHCRPSPAAGSLAADMPAQTLINILYYPSVNRVYGIPVTNPDGLSISEEFLAKFQEIASKDLDTRQILSKLDYITLPREMEELRSEPYRAPDGYTEILRNAQRSVYQRIP